MNLEEEVLKILESLVKKGLVKKDGDNYQITDSGVETVEHLLKTDPFTQTIYKMLKEEDKDGCA